MDNLEEIIQLINTDGIGPVTFNKLLVKYGSVQEGIKNLPPKYKLYPLSQARKENKVAKSKGRHIIS